MELIQKENYDLINELVSTIQIEKAYPSSILTGAQCGEIYVDSLSQPSCIALFHYCGFVYLAGKWNRTSLAQFRPLFDIKYRERHKSCSILVEKDDKIRPLLEEVFANVPQLQLWNRDLFEYQGTRRTFPVPDGFLLQPLTSPYVDALQGRIIPSYSFPSTADFIRNGFGVCIIDQKKGTVIGCAFSSGVGFPWIDIGIEVLPDYRGQGFASILAHAMVKETQRRGLTPDWGCATHNEGSRRTAKRVGFVKTRECCAFYFPEL